MERVDLSNSTNLSRIIYGMWRLVDDTDTSIKHIDDKINLCLNQGITTFDQASVYGSYTAEDIIWKSYKS